MNVATAAVWLLALVILLAVESSTTALVSIWFAVGSLAAFVLALVGVDIVIQIVAFVLVSLITIISLRPFLVKKLIPKSEATNADRILGQEGVVTQKIDNIQGRGEVQVMGMHWSARSEDGGTIKQGELVTILRIEGVKVFVRATQPRPEN